MVHPVDPAARAASGALARLNRYGLPGRSSFLIAGLFAIGLIGAVVALISRFAFHMPLWSLGVVSGMVAAALAGPLVLRDAARRFTQRRATALRTDRCPACWYELADAPTEPDGCRVCPECGAAWRFGERDPE